MSKFVRRVALLLTVGLTVAGCGGGGPSGPTGTTTVGTTPTTHAQRFCSGLTDKCVSVGKTSVQPNPITGASECKIPDVSNWQGHVNWAEAKPHVCGGIFKGGEALSPDVTAADNNHQLSSLHMWHAMYWFIRNSGCSSEASAIAREAHALHVQIVINDLESPSDNQGYGSCLPPLEKRAGLTPLDYTSPGTWSSGDGGFGAVPLWQAEYGPTLHPLWHPVVLWQCTDGHFGCVTNIPGIGVDDVSLNLGVTKLGPSPQPVVHKVRCYHHGWAQPRTKANEALCNRVRKHDSFLGVVVKHEDSFLAVTNGNVATTKRQIAALEKRLSVENGRKTAETKRRDTAYGQLQADLKKYGFTG